MKIIEVPNVHVALPRGLSLLRTYGQARGNRNEETMGKAIVAPWPVTTVYTRPTERVMLHPERDANPFFHLYESLWMLQGRNDVKPLLRYAKQMAEFSDNGVELYGAYGFRWRRHIGEDQLTLIIDRLRKNPEDRRCVLQMWDARFDLGFDGKDVPCNTIATFQRGFEGELNLDVFCRSNDIIWGAYGANAVHFSFLLEYMAAGIGCKVGVYRQHSVNYHAYEKTFQPLVDKLDDGLSVWSIPRKPDDPYADGRVRALPMYGDAGRWADFTGDIDRVMAIADGELFDTPILCSEFLVMANAMLFAHQLYRHLKGEDRYTEALHWLNGTVYPHYTDVDWMVAGREWIERRYAKWKEGQR
jgi:hypothetical protein